MRAPAPPYQGEGPHALWHVSEDRGLARFTPHRAQTSLTDEPLVWAVDTRHLPLYWFPRDCPRCTFWAGELTTDADLERFLDGVRTARIHVIEERWLERVGTTELQLYRMPEATYFCRPHISLGGITPAMAAGVAAHIWTVEEMVALLNPALAAAA